METLMTHAEPSSRRRFLAALGIGSLLAASRTPPAHAGAQASSQVPPAPWWPSRWGAGDQAGASNWITPTKVLDAVKWVRDGKIYRLGRAYESGMPLFGTRTFSLTIPGGPTGGPYGANRIVYHDEFVTGQIGQVGTQFDGLGHIGIQRGRDGDRTEMRYYNGFSEEEIASSEGLRKLGIEHVKPIVTRGHLLDLAGLKGRMLNGGEEITLADLRVALSRQGLREDDIKPGDAILFHTGWGGLWMKDNAKYGASNPGIGLEVARWVAERGLCLTAADTPSVEVIPNPDATLAYPVHGELLTKHGILNHENLVFDELLADRKFQFVYVFVPVPLKGATGSPGCPIAIT
jgi:kynurenine formamidase